MKTRSITHKESEELLIKIRNNWPSEVHPSKLKGVLLTQVAPTIEIIACGRFLVIQKDGKIIPFLGDNDTLRFFPSITVHSGAISHVCNGANIMRPGITSFSEYGKGDIVVVEAKYRKPIAVGEAILSSKDSEATTKGVIIQNLHYVGDKAWNTGKNLK